MTLGATRVHHSTDRCPRRRSTTALIPANEHGDDCERYQRMVQHRRHSNPPMSPPMAANDFSEFERYKRSMLPLRRHSHASSLAAVSERGNESERYRQRTQLGSAPTSPLAAVKEFDDELGHYKRQSATNTPMSTASSEYNDDFERYKRAMQHRRHSQPPASALSASNGFGDEFERRKRLMQQHRRFSSMSAITAMSELDDESERKQRRQHGSAPTSPLAAPLAAANGFNDEFERHKQYRQQFGSPPTSPLPTTNRFDDEFEHKQHRQHRQYANTPISTASNGFNDDFERYKRARQYKQIAITPVAGNGFDDEFEHKYHRQLSTRRHRRRQVRATAAASLGAASRQCSTDMVPVRRRRCWRLRTPPETSSAMSLCVTRG